ncbi:MAG: DUF5693 family protein, partial [Thermovirgaceae bacterium]
MRDWNRFFAFLLLLVLIASLPGIAARWRLESQYTETALVADVVDVEAVAEESGLTFMDAAKTLRNAGLTALAVHELTGEELSEGALPIEMGPAAGFFGNRSEVPEQAVLGIHADSPLTADILDYVTTKFPLAEVRRSGDILHVILPVSYYATLKMGLLPDFRGLDLASLAGMRIVYRPSPSPGVSGENVAAALSWLLNRHDSVNAVIPRGIVVPGYPDVKPLVEVLKSRNIAVAKVEFSGQIGASLLEKAMFPRVLPLHSVPDEEILVRNISRQELVDRFVRAARERSVRILYIRPPSFFSGKRLKQMEDECLAIAGRIQGLGLKEGWPSTYPLMRTGFWAAFALSLAVLVLVLKTGSRFLETEKAAQKKNPWMTVGVVLSLSLVLAPALLKASLLARIFGALAASFGATEATLAAVDGKDRPVRRILTGVVIALLTGLSIASFFGNTWYMLRMSAFSGVKISLLLPPVIVLLHDLRRRVHPESLE